jgi:nicotinamidase-related amidase
MNASASVPSVLPVAARPFEFRLEPRRAALVVIDMQRDFIEPGGFGAALGNDVSHLAAAVGPTRALLDTWRALAWPIVHTRESHAPDLSDCPPAKRHRGSPRLRIGDMGPMGRLLVRGEPGCDIVPALAPQPGEVVIDKPGKGSFCATDLELILRTRGIRNLVLTGITTDVCVHTTMREANDRGFECLILEDCTAATDRGNHEAALKMVTMQGGVFGAVSNSAAVIEAVNAL